MTVMETGCCTRKKPILIISGEFGVREVYDTDDPLPELQDETNE